MFNKYPREKKDAMILIILFGIISLLGDIIYEGARSVNGPYLHILGANALIVGFVVGIAEFLGYIIRLVSGYFSDKTKAHWFFTIFGYGLLISVPILSFSNIWQVAAIFIILERIGKGLRSPARDTIVSYATKQVGTGLGFGISEFLDQIGAALGPLIFTFLFFSIKNVHKTANDYQQGYFLLWAPFIVLMIVLFISYLKVKNPELLEKKQEDQPSEIPKTFWIYCVFSFFTTIGFINFAIVGYHLKSNELFSDAKIPLLYTFAMIVDAIFGIIVGRIYDKIKLKFKNENSGLLVLIFIPVITALILPFVFSKNFLAIATGMFLWGIVMGSHETIMKSAIADLTSIKKRGTAYGIFNTIYGLALFFGTALSGFLYEISISVMIFTLMCLQVFAVMVFLRLKNEIQTGISSGS